MDKCGIIDSIVCILDRLADAHGTEKCRLVIDGIQRCAALKDEVVKEDHGGNAETDRGA